MIICGLGNLGFRIYSQLDLLGMPLVVIDRGPAPEFVRRVRQGDDCLLRDDARQPEALAAADIATARVDGLDGCARWDAATDRRGVQQGPLTFDGEFDRVFDAPGVPLRVETGLGVLSVTQGGFAENVVWNPGAALCAKLPDMPPDGYRHMLCVESACVHEPVELAPGAEWTGWQQLQVVR